MPAIKYSPKAAHARAVKLNRKELTGVIDAFVSSGDSAGYREWQKACAKGIRNGKLDAASVGECIQYVSQEVQRAVANDDDPMMTDQDVRKMPKRLDKLASKYVE